MNAKQRRGFRRATPPVSLTFKSDGGMLITMTPEFHRRLMQHPKVLAAYEDWKATGRLPPQPDPQ